MRNTYKFTQLYSGTNPDFIEGDVFRTIVPLDRASATKLIIDFDQDRGQVTPQVTPQVDEKIRKRYEVIINFCVEPKSASEIMDYISVSNRKNLVKYILNLC